MYSPVANVQLLLALKDEKVPLNYLLLLAHEVVQYPEEFKRLMYGFRGTAILDNSLIELGRPAAPEVMLQAAEIVQPDFVVLPDMLSDAERTLAETQKALQEWALEMPAKTNFMVVGQGRDQLELLQCARDLIRIVREHRSQPMLGVPRVLTNTGMKRSTLVPMLSQLHAPIHLLGMSEDFADDMRCFYNRRVIGIDSATPIRCGYEDIVYGINGHQRPPMLHREKFFHGCKEVTCPMLYNIGFVNGMIELARNGI